MGLFGTDYGAEFSECGKYRYKLWRIWDEKLPLAMCIGLNPSNANASKDDPTIRILIRVLTKLGYGGFYMCNLFAFISPHPKDLLTVNDAVGENDIKLEEVNSICKDVIFCWGNFKQATERIKNVRYRFSNPLCFGYNQNGTPMHPMSLMYSGEVNSANLSPYA